MKRAKFCDVKKCTNLIRFFCNYKSKLFTFFMILFHWAVSSVYPLKVWKSPSLFDYFIHLYGIIDWATNFLSHCNYLHYTFSLTSDRRLRIRFRLGSIERDTRRCSTYFFLFLFLIGINLNLVFGRSARMGRACFCFLNRACESHKVVLLRLATDSLLSYFFRQLQFIFVNSLDTR